jgi:hypothetical protein
MAMSETPQGMTKREWMAHAVPSGPLCSGCRNTLGGKCRTWTDHEVTSQSKKCQACLTECSDDGSIYRTKELLKATDEG